MKKYLTLLFFTLCSLWGMADYVTPGYYYIVSGYDEFQKQQGVEKAWYPISSTSLGWKDFDKNDLTFVWKISDKEDGYEIKNVAYNSVVVGSETARSSKPVVMAPTTDRVTYIEELGDDQFIIYNDFYDEGYHTESHLSGAGESGRIVTWSGEAHTGSAWILRPVTDQTVIDNADAALHTYSLMPDAKTLYEDRMKNVIIPENALITQANDYAPRGTQGNQFVCNRKEANEGRYGALIDGRVEAHYNSSGDYIEAGQNFDGNGEWAYFHSAWHTALNAGAHTQDEYDFLQVDVSKSPVSSFVLRTAPRYNNLNAQPTEISIYATNDTTGYYAGTDKWTYITDIYPSICQRCEYYLSPVVTLGSSYKYLRFVISKTSNQVRYFTYAEFQLYKLLTSVNTQLQNLGQQIDMSNKAIVSNTYSKETYNTLESVYNAVKDNNFVTSITLNKTTASLNVGESITLSANVAPYNATNKNLTWTSSNTSVAIVNNGVVKAIASGTVTITAIAADGSGTKAECVIVTVTKVSSVTLSKTSVSLSMGQSYTLDATVSPNTATNKNLTWTTSNTSVATVSNGVIKAVSPGSATITAIAADGSGMKAKCSVTVTKGQIISTYHWEVKSQKNASQIHPGDTIVLEFCARPEFLGRYLSGSKLSEKGVLQDDNIYFVEEGPRDVRTGVPTIYLRSKGQDGYLTYNGAWQNISYSASLEQAANLQVLSCGEDIPWSNCVRWGWDEVLRKGHEGETPVANWRNPQEGKTPTDNSIGLSYSIDAETFTYLGSWNDADNIWFWQFTDTNEWNVYGVSAVIDEIISGDDVKMIPLQLLDYGSDVNKDGYVNSTDVVALYNIITGKDGGKQFTANSVSFTMISVEGGTVEMDSLYIKGSEAHMVYYKEKLSNYLIGETEVTQELWTAVMGSNPSKFQGENLPVANVSWDDCQTFITKLNQLTGKKFRLPTRAEWKFAASGGKESKGYQYYGSNRISDVAWFKRNSGGAPHSVKTKLANELGIYDMSGNVSEWCQDLYRDERTNYVFIGGDWTSDAEGTTTFGLTSYPKSSNNVTGLRLALSE